MKIDGVEIVLEPGYMYSAKITAKIIRKSTKTLSSWRTKGKNLPYTKLGTRDILYDGGDIAKHLEGITVKSTSEYRVKKAMAKKNKD